MFKEIKKDKRDFSDRQWETIKFFTYIFIALLTAYITLITLIGLENSNKILILSFIPVTMIIFSFLGWLNFRRESARLFETIATIKKIEKKLNFLNKRDNKKDENQEDDLKVLEDDKYYLSDRMVNLNPEINNTKKFIKEMMEKGIWTSDFGNVYSCFKWIFTAYVVLAFLLLFAVLHLSSLI